MNNKLKSFLEPSDFKLEGILTSDNKKIGSYFINYINGSIYQFYNNSNDTITNYEHILILFLTEEDDFLKEVREIRKIKMIENGRNFDGEDITKTTELDNMKLAYYCDVHDRRKIKETMLVFSSYNMKASNVKKEANELLSRRQQENSLETYRDGLLRLSEDMKVIGNSVKTIQEKLEIEDECPNIAKATFKFNGEYTTAIGTYKFLSEYQTNLEKYGEVDLILSYDIENEEEYIIKILNKKKITKGEFNIVYKNKEVKAVNVGGTLNSVSMSGKRSNGTLEYRVNYKGCDYYITVMQ